MRHNLRVAIIQTNKHETLQGYLILQNEYKLIMLYALKGLYRIYNKEFII